MRWVLAVLIITASACWVGATHPDEVYCAYSEARRWVSAAAPPARLPTPKPRETIPCPPVKQAATRVIRDQYFPTGVLGCGEQSDELLTEWYAKHLKALGEPSLWELSRSDRQARIYRFLWHAGRRIQQSAKTTRKTIAVEAEKTRRKELERAYAGLPTGDAKIRVSSVRDFLKPYRENYDLNHRPQSVAFAKGRLAHVDRLLGSVLLPNLTEQRIREYIRTRLGEGVSGRTINMELGELSRAMGKTWRDLWPKVRKLEEKKDVGHALTTEEEQLLLHAAAEDQSPNRSPMLYTILRVALATGMRSGEIISLRWGQVDLTKKLLTVGRAKTSSGTGRQIPMNSELEAVLSLHASWFVQKFGEIQPVWYVFPGRLGKPQKGNLRPFDVNRPCSTIKTSWNTVRRRAGVQCRLHDLRHTAATKMAEAGVPESTMLAIMGHMSRAMLERYSHIRLEAKRQAVEALQSPTRTDGSTPLSTFSTTAAPSTTIQ